MNKAGGKPINYVFIPDCVLHDHQLPYGARLLFGEIAALNSNEKGYCWAGNDYLADLYGVSTRTITAWAKALEKQGYIAITVSYRSGTKRITRHIKICAKGKNAERAVIIPASVHFDESLPYGARLLFGEIAALNNNEKGYCWASNAYFADSYGYKQKAVLPATISSWVQELKKKGYITTEVTYFEGTRRIDARHTRIAVNAAERPLKNENPQKPVSKKALSDANKARPDANNTSKGINNTSRVLLKINNRATAAAEKTKKAEKAEANFLNFEQEEGKIKAELKKLDPQLVLSKDFYPKAAAFLKQRGLSNAPPAGYFQFLYKKCVSKKNLTSLNGLFYTLFFKPEVFELYCETQKPQAPSLPQTIVCPVCGTPHSRGGGCPLCGLPYGAGKENIERHKILYAMPAGRKTAYENAVNALAGVPFAERMGKLRELNRAYFTGAAGHDH